MGNREILEVKMTEYVVMFRQYRGHGNLRKLGIVVDSHVEAAARKLGLTSIKSFEGPQNNTMLLGSARDALRNHYVFWPVKRIVGRATNKFPVGNYYHVCAYPTRGTYEDRGFVVAHSIGSAMRKLGFIQRPGSEAPSKYSLTCTVNDECSGSIVLDQTGKLSGPESFVTSFFS